MKAETVAVTITKQSSFIDKLKTGLAPPLQFAAILTVAYVLLLMLPEAVRASLGIRSRSLSGLPSILLHPLWHHSASHLFCNALGIIMLGGIISLRSRQMLLRVTAVSWLGGGALLWLFGRSAGNVGGASVIVYGYLGFILLHGIFERSVKSIALAILVVYFFTDLLFGMGPAQAELSSAIRLSWEGHLCGFIAGALCAYLSVYSIKGQRLKPPKPKKETPREKAEKLLFSDEIEEDPRETIVDQELAAIKRKVGK